VIWSEMWSRKISLAGRLLRVKEILGGPVWRFPMHTSTVLLEAWSTTVAGEIDTFG
jgi:hypothetical protein